eukprot:gnl/TRDRNA2_/TRDRNA2_199710_c0_seq1.p1 gnl/TRDRNA2_/TRDRNA2_199710_c0~~gnl/TRDRNA2_/TRDRNA2_199710_c0_seq1.p1  ORF type:complete len:251 (-),score=39.53 gnl/TRDRNA2_/TRDRNA2_199710_c0_seq1:49-801(-)
MSATLRNISALCPAVAFGAVYYLFYYIVVPHTPGEILMQLPWTHHLIKGCINASLALPFLALFGVTMPAKCFIRLYIVLSIFALGTGIFSFLLYRSFYHYAIPMIWEGVPEHNVKGFPEQCVAVPHSNSTCNYKCTYSIQTMTDMCSTVALAKELKTFVKMPNADVVVPEHTDEICVPDASYKSLEDLHSRHKDIEKMVLYCLGGATAFLFISFFLGFLMNIYVKDIDEMYANARESKVEPLMQNVYEKP